MSTFVIVHGAWHTGAEFESTAAPLRAAGHIVHLPTLAGNRAGDPRSVGLAEAIDSLVAFLGEADLHDVVLVGHSYGGMVITGAADRELARIRRLVYWNAFVPNDGEALIDMVPPQYLEMFESLVATDGSLLLPFSIWREAFINDADLALAESSYRKLNPHPWRTFSDKIRLTRNPAAFTVGKSYINCTEDTSLPHTLPWHPRLSQKLGLFRLVQVPGSHELCFTAPARLAQAILDAGRD
ncbi:MAG: alpha/beta hydrolase [Gammaproteobacteria bacterium]|nr:alpha/beta hydrolase [Gammaproteobacteria bacterium]